MPDQLSKFFNPSGVALVGASSNPSKLSHGILKNMLSYGYSGKIYPINPSASEILGLPCYPDIDHLPGKAELAVIVLPAPHVPEALESCGAHGVQAAIIISGGFKEVGPEGLALEKKCLDIAARYHMRLIGPNCVGTVDLHSGLNTTFIRGLPDKGNIGFISQSGAVCGAIVDYMLGKGVGFSHFVSLGNEADVTETDMIELLSQEKNTKVIAVYVEGIRDGQRFIEVSSKVTPQKPIVILKAGRSEAGARAVSSHTGSLAGSQAAYEAAFLQSGVLVADGAAELFDIALALDYQPLPAGNRIAIITNAGGPAALASDSFAQNGLQLADLSETTRQRLRERLNPSAQVANPIDMLGGANGDEYAWAIENALADDGVDMVLATLVPQSLVSPTDIARAIVKASANTHKPVAACMVGDASIGEARQVLHSHRIPMYVFPEQAGRALGAMLQYARWKNQPAPESIQPLNIDRQKALAALALAGSEKNLGEAAIRPLLEAYGIPLVRAEIAHSAPEAAHLAEKIGFPVVLKIVSPDILHKSDAGGILLNVQSAAEASEGYAKIMQRLAAALPQARLEGVLIEPMLQKGQEVIVGMRRDPQFGPLMMFGLGGIYVELFGDVAFRVAPLSRSQILAMIQATRAGRLLAGLRGQDPADLDAVVDCIFRLSQLALDFPELEELEVNPLLVAKKGQGAAALDARAIRKV